MTCSAGRLFQVTPVPKSKPLGTVVLQPTVTYVTHSILSLCCNDVDSMLPPIHHAVMMGQQQQFFILIPFLLLPNQQ